MTDLNLKVAMVTGGARGIGAAVARGLAANGARRLSITATVKGRPTRSWKTFEAMVAKRRPCGRI